MLGSEAQKGLGFDHSHWFEGTLLMEIFYETYCKFLASVCHIYYDLTGEKRRRKKSSNQSSKYMLHVLQQLFMASQVFAETTYRKVRTKDVRNIFMAYQALVLSKDH